MLQNECVTLFVFKPVICIFTSCLLVPNNVLVLDVFTMEDVIEKSMHEETLHEKDFIEQLLIYFYGHIFLLSLMTFCDAQTIFFTNA